MHIDATPPAPLGRALPLAAELFAAAKLHAVDGIHMDAEPTCRLPLDLLYGLHLA